MGSIRINLNSEGENLYKRLASKVFIKTDFPEPVVPATRRWGVLLKSITSMLPEISLPIQIGIL